MENPNQSDVTTQKTNNLVNSPVDQNVENSELQDKEVDKTFILDSNDHKIFKEDPNEQVSDYQNQP